MKNTELDVFRARWRRWLGQVTRVDKPTWTKLLESNWLGWPDKVLGDDMPRVNFATDRISLYIIYRAAIDRATLDQLRKLDSMYCEEKHQRLYERGGR